MNSTRRNMLLAVVLGFLVLLDLGSAPDNRPARDVGPLLPQLDVQRAARIELLGTAGESLVLERGDLGWVLRGVSRYSRAIRPAFLEPVGELLGPIDTTAGWALLLREQ